MNLAEIASLLNCDYPSRLPNRSEGPPESGSLTTSDGRAGDWQGEITGVCIDSRHVKPGNLFVAILGERFDGHDFVQDAVAAGAVGVVCSRINSAIHLPQFQVVDTVQALANLAKAHRETLNCQVVALTGSNGKTTVKEMIAAILPQPSHATPGNLNNHLGVPLSVLQLNKTHRYAVFELGANHPGEIAYTVSLVKPDVTLINNIAPAHIAGFGSIEGVARAKGEIHQGLSNQGTAVINEEDAYAHYWDNLLTDKKILRFSTTKPLDITLRDMCMSVEGRGQFTLVTPNGQVAIALRVAGLHNVSNALAAAACAHALGIDLSDIAAGLQSFQGVAGRMTYLPGINDSIVIDDTYNANLRSTIAAIDVLAKRKGRRIFVFGDMGELGSYSKQHHQEIGEVAKKQGIDMLMTCGKDSEFTAKAYGLPGRHYTQQKDLIADLLRQLDANTTVLVKGSRASAMEKIVQQLVNCSQTVV